MKEFIVDMLQSNTTTLLYGKSGWGKSEIVKQASKELNMPCIVLALAGSAPEDFGIPKVYNKYYDFLPPKWVADFAESGKPFVLFLDEITQATVQVLHAIYPIVLDRRIGNIHLPDMRVIAASNYSTENQYLTDIMQPLLNRFVAQVEIEKAFGQTLIDNFWEYIQNKYPRQESVINILRTNQILTNPRDYEAALKFLDTNQDAEPISTELVLRRCLHDMATVVLEKIKQDDVIHGIDTEHETFKLSRLRQASFVYKSKFLVRDGGRVISNPSRDEIITEFALSPEECESVFI